MARWVLTLFLAAAAAPAQEGKPAPQQGQKELKTQRPAQQQGEKEEVPPEEDTDLAPKVYAFNPLQAEKEVRVGNYYFHKGKFRAAAGRYLEATKWNDGYGEAWLKLAEAREKTKDTQAAKEAYAKYLQISPDAKNAGEIRKKMEKMK